MIRVGFILNCDANWMGGLNYLRNLLFAISAMPGKRIHPIVFIGHSAGSELHNFFKPYAEVITLPLFDRNSPLYWLWKATKHIFRSDAFLEFALKKYKIDVFSHSMVLGLKKAKIINWIPDFQHLHLPQLFSPAEIEFRNHQFLTVARKSDTVILSSNDAFKDFRSAFADYSDKVRVLHFVAQPDRRLFRNTPEKEAEILEKHGIRERYFFIPNQFWKHKNHRTVFEAIKLLKDKGHEIMLVCSGAKVECRNQAHIEELQKMVSDLHLNIKILGLIDYEEVFILMKRSMAVINPSLFEGWSSTVEECKSIGKNMILSDIPVHREQNHPLAVYFPPLDSEELSRIMLQTMLDTRPVSAVKNETDLLEKLEQKTLEFARSYEQIVCETIEISK